MYGQCISRKRYTITIACFSIRELRHLDMNIKQYSKACLQHNCDTTQVTGLIIIQECICNDNYYIDHIMFDMRVVTFN